MSYSQFKLLMMLVFCFSFVSQFYFAAISHSGPPRKTLLRVVCELKTSCLQNFVCKGGKHRDSLVAH